MKLIKRVSRGLSQWNDLEAFLTKKTMWVIFYDNTSVKNISKFRYNGTHISDKGNFFFLNNFMAGRKKYHWQIKTLSVLVTPPPQKKILLFAAEGVGS